MKNFARPYEVFEHTADVGLHVYGRDLPELFSHAAQGMESLMVAPEQIKPATTREVTVEAHDHLSLLIGWLDELIFLFDTQFLLVRDVEILDLTETRLKARVTGEAYDAQRHELASAIKAVTWHEAAITCDEISGSYQARIIFDI
ncbi:archease [Ktedonobacter robiniae]|uniref:Protein archease n=1 Tax=Ktedonobacter robiniae TaxID=2778365 RepID=A0ABQ3UT25_9CHLR|nr:archease [Ktedonobacter robiniae]GHO55540.1 protein archease [Ktedonobacter robiniae]